MTGLLLQIGATKLVISVVLAGAAWIVHRRVGLPAVSHPLWLLVLATLLVPAVVSLPVLPAEPGAPLAGLATGLPEVVFADAVAETANGPRLGVLVQPGLVIMIWLLGTAGLLGWTLLRTARFQRILTKASRRAPAREGAPGTEAGGAQDLDGHRHAGSLGSQAA